MGAPGSRECSHVLATTFSSCKELGVSLAMDKVEGPAASLTFLGIHLCSSPLSVSLPCEKVAALHSLLRELLSSKCVRDVQTLESLISYLVHATKVCPLAKPFLGGLFQVLRGARAGQPRRLNATMQPLFGPLLMCILHPFTGAPGTDSAPLSGTSGLDISSLEGALYKFMEAGLSDSTRRVYRAGWNHFLSFTRAFSLPATPITASQPSCLLLTWDRRDSLSPPLSPT